MDSSLKKKLENMTEADLEKILGDIADLKRDVAKSLNNIKSNTLDTAIESAQDMAESLSDEAMDIYKDLQKRGKKYVKVINRQVEDQPAMSILLAFSMGFIVSRLMR